MKKKLLLGFKLGVFGCATMSLGSSIVIADIVGIVVSSIACFVMAWYILEESYEK